MSFISEGITSKLLISFQIFFWKLEFFHHLHLFYITYLLIFRCISHLLLSSQLKFNSLKHTILKTSQNVMYGVNLWYTEKHCNAGESKTYSGCSTQFTKGIVRTYLKHYTLSSHGITDFLQIKRIPLKRYILRTSFFPFFNLSLHPNAVLLTVAE